MAQYKKSDGQTIETSLMNEVYLQRALEKAKKEGNDANVIVLEDEIKKRQQNS